MVEHVHDGVVDAGYNEQEDQVSEHVDAAQTK